MAIQDYPVLISWASPVPEGVRGYWARFENLNYYVSESGLVISDPPVWPGFGPDPRTILTMYTPVTELATLRYFRLDASIPTQSIIRSCPFAPSVQAFMNNSGLGRAAVISTELRGAELSAQCSFVLPEGQSLGALASITQTYSLVKLPADSWSYTPPEAGAQVRYEQITRAVIDAGQLLDAVTFTFEPQITSTGDGLDNYSAVATAAMNAAWPGGDDFHLFLDSSGLWTPGGTPVDVDFEASLRVAQSAPGGLFWTYEPLAPPPGLGVTPPLLARGRTARWFAAKSEVVGNAPPMPARGRPW